MRHAPSALLPFALWAALPIASGLQGAPARAEPPPTTPPQRTQPPPRLLVVPGQGVQMAQIDALYAALAAAGVDVVGVDGRLGVHLPPHPERFSYATIEAVTAQLATAREAYRQLELDATFAAIDQAERAFFRLRDPTAQLAIYSDLLLLRAQAALAAGQPERAQAALMLYVRLAPERQALHPGRYPPHLVQAHQKARAAAELSPTGLLSLTARTTGGAAITLSVDGQVTAPGTQLQQTGPHLVVATAPERITRAAIVAVHEAEPARFDAVLPQPGASTRRAALVQQLNAAPPPQDPGEILVALAALSGATTVLWASPARSLLWRQDVSTVALPPLTDNVIALANATKDALRRDPIRSPDTTLAQKKSPARTRRKRTQAPLVPPSDTQPPWLWIGSAAGVTALLLGAGASAWLGFALTRPEPQREVVGFCCRTGGQ